MAYLLRFWLVGVLAMNLAPLGRAQTPAHLPSARATRPPEAEELLNHAQRLFNQGQIRSAVHYYQQLSQQQPRLPQVWLGLAQCHQALGDTSAALARYTQALDLTQGQLAEARFGRAMLYYQRAMYGFAITDFTALLALPTPGATQTVYFAASGRGPVQGLQSLAGSQAPVWHYLGLCRLKTNDLAGAIANFDQAIALDARQPAYWVNRGLAHQQAGQVAAARADYQQALVLEPDDGHALYNLTLLAEKGPGGVQALTQVIEQTGGHAGAYLNRAYLHLEQGQPAAALVDLDSALALGSRDYEVYFNRALANERLQRYAAALADYRQALRLAPSAAKAYAGRAGVYHKLKNYGQALADYDLAIAHAPQCAHFYYNRALVHQALGQLPQACTDAKKAQALGQRNVDKVIAKFCR
ncbi:MAG: tetratricopeptide repeat protein [Bernardetiaceae bacterium]|nr:tetratricopeptide repeat protein [Bernardetiaceae bacterium]